MKKLGILLIGLFVVSLVAAPAFAWHVDLIKSPVTVGAFGGVALNGGRGNIGQTGFDDTASSNVSSTHMGFVVGGLGNGITYSGDPVLHGSSTQVIVTNPIIIYNSSSSKAVSVNVIGNSF